MGDWVIGNESTIFLSNPRNHLTKGSLMPDTTDKVGETPEEQSAPLSTVARERFVEIIANNKKVIADAEAMLILINNDPDLDASMCRLFGIAKNPQVRDVSR